VTALLLAVAVLVGLGIGHGVWNSHVSVGSPSGGSANGLGGNNGLGGSNGSGTNGGSNGLGNNFGGNGNSGTGGTGTGGGSSSAAASAASNDLVDIDTVLSYANGEAAGTGIVLSSDGYILTNNHVISGATAISATDIANGQKYTADVVGYDRTHDVAVIKLRNASGLKVASIGNSSQVSTNESVIGLGNAGGVGGTPSVAPGQVTDLNQSITAEDESNGTSEKLSGLIETNCNIQPGDSGGALIDSSGRVVGMDTAASTGFSFQTQGNQGFAIPINSAVTIANQIRSGQASQSVHIGNTAFLGVEIDTSQSAQGTQGAVVSKPISGGPAAAAGIVTGDVITQLGGQAVDTPSTLTNLIGKYHPGDQVAITWLTATGQTQNATVVLANGPAA
jgi:S1-C subfamily serine protease